MTYEEIKEKYEMLTYEEIWEIMGGDPDELEMCEDGILMTWTPGGGFDEFAETPEETE